MQLGQLHDVSHADLLGHARKGDLLLLRTICRVGQQERPFHAGARPAHRLVVIEISLDELDMRARVVLGLTQITRERPHRHTVSRKSSAGPRRTLRVTMRNPLRGLRWMRLLGIVLSSTASFLLSRRLKLREHPLQF
jgi:hypothetical protein